MRPDVIRTVFLVLLFKNVAVDMCALTGASECQRMALCESEGGGCEPTGKQRPPVPLYM